MLLLKTPAGSSSIWFPTKLLQQEYIMDFSWAFLKCPPVVWQKHSARKPFLTKLVNDITLRKWWLNREQTNNTFNVYWLLIRRSTRSCFWRLEPVASLSGFHVRFYNKIHIKFKLIFQRFLWYFCYIFPILSLFSGIFALDLFCSFRTFRRELVHQSISQFAA